MQNDAGGAARTGEGVLRACVLALPVVLVLFLIPPAESPFLLPKRALLITLSVALFSFAAACGVLKKLDRAAALILIGIPAAGWLSWLVSSRREFGPEPLAFLCAAPLLAWTAASVLRREERALVVAVAVAGVIEAAVVLAQWFTPFNLLGMFGYPPDAFGRMRLYGLAGNPDFAGIVIAATLAPLLMLAAERRGWRRYALLLVAALTAVAIAGTACRTALVAGATGALAAFAVRRGSATWKRVAAVVLVLGAIAGTVWIRNPRPADVAARGRVFVMRVVLASDWKHPLGSGPGTFANRYPRLLAAFMQKPRIPQAYFGGYERTPNNDFVQALSENGWLGVAALVAVGLFAIWKLIRQARQAGASLVPAAALGSVVALLVAAQGESPLQRGETWALLWLWVAVAIVGAREDAETRHAASLQGHLRLSWWRFAVAAVVTLLVAAFAVRAPLASVWAGRAGRLEARAQYPAAVDAYRRSIAICPSVSSAPFNLPRALAEAGDLEASANAALDGVRWVDEPELYLMRVRILEARGEWVSVLRVAQEASADFPYSNDLHYEFAKLAARLTSH